MRKLSLGAIALIFSFFAIDNAKAQGPLGQILDRMDGNYKGLSSLKADVIMTKWDNTLKDWDIPVSGNTSYLPKNDKRVMYVRLDWTSPSQEQMVVIGEDYKLYRSKVNQLIVGKTSGTKNKGAAGGAFAFISMSRTEMKANYNVVYIGRESIKDGVLTTHLQLTPKKLTSYKRADLWVDNDGMPRQSTITEMNDDTTTILLENIRKNVNIDYKSFILDPPGAKVIKN